jgi:tryptophan synthase alpha chain
MGLWGIIIPDAPIDEAAELYEIANNYGINPIVIATPYTDDSRLMKLASKGKEFIYYVPRKGVTGTKTSFAEEVRSRILHIKKITGLECAVGFGIQEKEDIDFLSDCADIAVIGSKITRIIEENGIEEVDTFLKEIRKG